MLQNHIIFTFAQNERTMNNFTLSVEDWGILKLKLLRKYNHLSEEDLNYTPGEEALLIARLAKRLKRTEDYVIFTLKKGLSDLTSNRL